jgi:hypothetical protein
MQQRADADQCLVHVVLTALPFLVQFVELRRRTAAPGAADHSRHLPAQGVARTLQLTGLRMTLPAELVQHLRRHLDST